MLQRSGRALLVSPLLAALLGGCAGSIEDQAHDELQDQLDGVHEGFLRARSLDRYGDPSEFRAGDDSIVLIKAIGVHVQRTSGIFPEYEQMSLGACVRVTIRAGDSGSDRGSVTTEPVECPATEDFETGGTPGPVDRFTTDLDSRSGDVGEPPPPRSVCHSGDVCTEGGG